MPDPNERFTVGCPKCAKRYVLTVKDLGKKATCKCGGTFTVRKPEEDEEEEEEAGDYRVAQT
jgi:hypothetical protein